MARKSGPRKPKTDSIGIAARATRRRRIDPADEKPSRALEAEIVDPEIVDPQNAEPEIAETKIVDDDNPAATPLAADLAEIGELPEGFARAPAGSGG